MVYFKNEIGSEKMNDKKVAFIICSNNETMLEECLNYMSLLEVPNEIETEVIVIKEANSMLLGMQEGREATDAKYKVYLHQDTFILNKYFIKDILSIFSSRDNIGLIGMVGSRQLPSCGTVWRGNRVGKLYIKEPEFDYHEYRYDISDGVWEVDVVDGFLMATSVDIPLRTDLFDGWDFYDVSVSLEYRKKGYKVIVPYQKIAWCLHDDGKVLSLWNYDKYRKVALTEYEEFIQGTKGDITLEMLLENFWNNKNEISIMNIEEMLSSPEGRGLLKNNQDYMNLFKMIQIYRLEQEAGLNQIFENVDSYEKASGKIKKISFILYRICVGMIDEDLINMFNDACNEDISIYAYLAMSLYFNYQKEEVVASMADFLDMLERKSDKIRLLNGAVKIYDKNEDIAMKLLDTYISMGMLDEAKKLIKTSILMEREEFANIVLTE